MIVIRGKTVVLKPIGIREIGSVARHLIAIQKPREGVTVFDQEMLDHFLAVIHAAVRKQVRDVTREEVEEALDITNLKEVIQAVMPPGSTTLRA